jgi:glycine betaine/choline ABC-type transport system substrate-binding protein
MRSSLRALLAILAVLSLALFVGACGDDSEEGGSAGSSTEPAAESGETGEAAQGKQIQRDPANASKTFTVGSKNFPEQYILGEIYAQSLEAAGFKVKKQLDLGSEQVAFKSLRDGRIDAYPEYTGTALTSFYRVKTDDIPRDKDQAFDQLKSEAAKDNITTLPQTPFQNTFVITSTTKTAEELGSPKTITELAKKAGKTRSISGFPECRQRTDCLLGLKNSYQWEPKFVSSQGKYEDLNQGQADFTFGFGTDGELKQDKYATYEDDKQLFPPYYITLMTRNTAIEKLGESGQQVIEQVQEPLTEEVMQELNSRVTSDKQEPEKVAADYLKEAGFVGGT